MRKGKMMSKIFGIALVFVMIGAMLSSLLGAITPLDNLPKTVQAATLADGKGIWIWKIWELGEGVSGIINKLNSAGVEWVTIKCGDSNSYYPDHGKMLNWLQTNGYSGFGEVVTRFHNAGIKVFGWQYVYSYSKWTGTGHSTEAEVSNLILDIPGIDGLIIDAEAEYEGEGKGPIAEAYMIDIRNSHPSNFIAYSTFPIIDYHLWFPYIEFGRYCDAVMPQAYWKDIGVTPTEMVNWINGQWDKWHETWKSGGYGDSVKPLIPVGQGNVSGSEITEFCELVLSRYEGASLWRYGTMTSEAWSAYAAIGGADTTPPTVDAFDVTPPSVTLGNAFTISYTVSDTGGSGLKRVELWRGNDVGGVPDWGEYPTDNPKNITPLSGQTSYSGSFTDTPPSQGTYWYGIHIVDNAENWNDEQNSHTGGLPGDFGPIEVEVVINNPPQLSDGCVNPPSGNSLTDFWWYVTYFDPDGDTPSVKRAIVDGTAYTMSEYSYEDSWITYRYGPKNLSCGGTHYYFFYFEDGRGGTSRLPTGVDMYLGPTVTDLVPVTAPDLVPDIAHNVETAEESFTVIDTATGDPVPGVSVSNWEVTQGCGTGEVMVIDGGNPSPIDPTMPGNNFMTIRLVTRGDCIITALVDTDCDGEPDTSVSAVKKWGEISRTELDVESTGAATYEACDRVYVEFLNEDCTNLSESVADGAKVTWWLMDYNAWDDADNLNGGVGIKDLLGCYTYPWPDIPYSVIDQLQTLYPTSVNNTFVGEDQKVETVSGDAGATGVSCVGIELLDDPGDVLLVVYADYPINKHGENRICVEYWSWGPSGPRTWYVDDDRADYPGADFVTIQDAVDAGSYGDTILVYPGIYTENVDVNKDHLTIQSENGAEATIVQAANSYKDVFKVTASCVNVSGFTVKGANSEEVIPAGIKLDNYSENNTLSGNIVSNNCYGIFLSFSSNNTLVENTVLENRYNLSVEGTDHSHFTHNVDTSNKVNGKRVQYLIDEKDVVIDSSWDVGYLGLVNCTNITIKDFTITNNGQGVLLAYSSNSRIKNVTASGNKDGIVLCDSSSNEITENNLSNNSDSIGNGHGVELYRSSNNKITNNNMSSNAQCGIDFNGSNNNLASGNSISNSGGIWLHYSTNNTIINNTFDRDGIDIHGFLHNWNSHTIENNTVDGKPICYYKNMDGVVVPSNAGQVILVNCTNFKIQNLNLSYVDSGIILGFSSNNIVSQNSISSCYLRGIDISGSTHNEILNNNISLNHQWGIVLWHCSTDNVISNNNIFLNNWDGVALRSHGAVPPGCQRNLISNNNITNNHSHGISLDASSNNTVSQNNIEANHGCGITIWGNNGVCNYNTVFKNNIVGNGWNGIYIYRSAYDNVVYLNNLIGNGQNAAFWDSTNTWNSPEEITYTYNSKTYINYLGNYWSDYSGSDADGDGVGDTPYPIDSDKDNYPLIEPFENYEIGVAPTLEWSKTFGGTADDRGYSVRQTSDGGYIVAGSGEADVWLIKTDSNGNKVWDKTFGGANRDLGLSVQQTLNGGYIMVGWTASYGAGGEDVWLIKTDSNGDKLWDKTFGGENHDHGHSVQQTLDGGYIIVGNTQCYEAGNWDIWLIKTDPNGNKVWDKTFGGESDDIGYAVQQTSDGGYIVTGDTFYHGAGSDDVWLIKTDSNGDKVWDKIFGGTGGDSGSSVQQTSDGGYIITGVTWSYGAGNTDVWLIKTDSNGDKVWDKTFGGENHDHGYSVQQTSDGGYIMAGNTQSYGAGEADVWLIKTDPNGNKAWDRTFGGKNNDYGFSIEQTSDGGYIIGGETESFGPGACDVWLLKLGTEGPPPKTWYVDDDGADYPAADFTKIQDAVDAASAGDTIIVYPGTYTENVDVNNDHLTIKSEKEADSTIVQAANPGGSAFKISRDYVTIDGFTIRDGEWGIYLLHSNHNELKNNNITNNQFGIVLDFSSYNILHNNVFVNNGLAINDSYENLVQDNTVNGKPLAYLEDVSNAVITDAGQVILINCDSITIENLNLSHVSVGIELWNTNESVIKNNNLSNNRLGIVLANSSENEITNNSINSNGTLGLALDDSNNNTIYLNNFASNDWNAYSQDSTNTWNSPEEITYTYNGNTFTSYLGNYWSDYTGRDANGNGIGDTLYSIDSDADNYPLMEPFETYGIGPASYPVITSPLEITPEKDKYYVGDALTAKFTITNRGTESVTFDVLTVGGRLNGGCQTEGCPDFTYQSPTLEPGESYQYEGSLALTQSGTYHFFCAYHTEEYTPGEDENNWNTNIDVEVDGQIIEDFNEARRYREKDITVLEETYIQPVLGPSSWEKISGPWEEEIDPYGDFSALLEKTIAIDPNNPEIVYIASDKGGGLYKSVDGGGSWQEINNGLPDLSWPVSSKYWPVGAIAIARSNPEIVYIGTTDINPYHSWVPSGMGIYKSANGGTSWIQANGINGGQFPKYPISSMVVDPTNANIVYVGTIGGGIWKTKDGGESWQQVWSPIGELCFDVNALAISPANPSIIYAADYNYLPLSGSIPTGIVFQRGLYRSGDGGNTWEKVWGKRVDDIVVDNKDANILYTVICGYKVYKSVDGGMNWDNASGTGGEDPLPAPVYDDPSRIGRVYSLAMDPDFTNVIYSANKWDCQAGGIHFSPDAGEDWFPIGLQDERVEKINLASNSDYRVLYAVTIEGLFKLDLSNSAIVVQKYSAVELRVYDSQERVTGLVEGEARGEIPGSVYYDGTITIFSSTDSYRYELVGTDEGRYGLGVTSVEDGEASSFAATDIPIISDAVHQYTIDWDALSQGEEGVTVQVDSDGDGDFEETIVTSQPNTPSSPSPANDAANVSRETDLSWSGGDPDAGDIVTYDVYFDTTNATTLVSNDQSETVYDPGDLNKNTGYYWKIVARDNHGITKEGPLWDFTTGSQAGDEDNPDVATGLDSIEDWLVIAYGYKVGEGVGGWTVYNPEWAVAHPEWNTLTTLYLSRGYWINVSGVCDLTYGANTYQLDAGWNLIGWCGAAVVSPPSDEDNPDVAVGLTTLGDELVKAYGYKVGEGVWGWTVYNPEWAVAHPEWNSLTTLYVQRGYWINVSGVCDLTYGANAYELDEGWNLIGWMGY